MASSSLPPELWDAIVHCLQLPPLRLGDTKPNDSYHSNQAALRNLCLASRQLQTIARRVLYHSVILYDSASPALYLLVRTLATKRELATFVRNLAVVTPDPNLLEKTLYCELLRRCLGASVPIDARAIFQAPPDEPGFFHTSGLSLTSLSPDIFERLLGSLLCLLPNVQRLLIELPPLYHEWNVVEEVMQYQILARVLAGGSSSRDALPLPNLTTLQVQAHPRTNGNGLYLDSVNMRACPILLDLPSIRTLDTYHTDGEDWLMDYTHGNWLAKLRKMRLYTGMHMRKLERVLQSASNLDKLELMLDCCEEESFDDFGDLNQALATRADTLQDLFISLQGAAGYTPILGHEIRLGCLPLMHKLRILHTETNLLFYKKSRMKADELDLHMILPPNLQELRLEECWYISDEDSDDMGLEEYIGLLLSQFKTLALFRDKKLPKLERVRFWSWEWTMKHKSYWTRKSAVNFLRKSSKLLGAANIKFSALALARDFQPELLEKHSVNREYAEDPDLDSDVSNAED